MSDGFGGWSNSYWNCCAEEFSGCLFGFCCPSCYMAKARTKYDESNFCFNCMCIGSCVLGDIVREGYRIEGGACESCKCLCPPCHAIQTNAEVTKRGQLEVTKTKQDAEWTNGLLNCCSDGCGSLCCAFLFLPCYVAKTRTRYDGSSCISNFLCLASPAVRNIIREGYGIKGTCCGDILYTCCCPCCSTIQLNAEISTRGSIQSQKNKTVQHVTTQMAMTNQ
eukprot:944315_1